MPSHPRACKVHIDGLARIKGVLGKEKGEKATLSGALEAPPMAD